MKTKNLIKSLLPKIIGIIFSVAFIVFVLCQLSATSYVVLLGGLNILLLWYFIKDQKSAQGAWNIVKEYRDLIEALEDRIEELEDKIEEIENTK